MENNVIDFIYYKDTETIREFDLDETDDTEYELNCIEDDIPF